MQKTKNPTFNLVDTVAEIINFGGQGTDINIGSSFGTTTINNDLVVKGDLIIEGVTAMEFRASCEDISMISHPHPTYSEAIKEAALSALENRPLHI